jgi:nicotinate-nucleotide pyrophosphorylase (carboxylating)
LVQQFDPPPRAGWLPLVEAALAEDVGPGDATTLALIPPQSRGSARLEARQPVVVCGMEIAREVFARCGVDFSSEIADGASAERGAILGQARGPSGGILTGERTALNFVQRLTGVATLTRRYVEAVRGTACEVVDTRKTTPGWRVLEKYAVRCGGGRNHRMGLFDGILIKDNHIAALGSVREAVRQARERGSRHLRIRVEIESLDQAREALEAGADSILIDNQKPDDIRAIVRWAAGRLRTEASGGITLASIAEVARTGVDEISVGALTHSAPAADVALEWNAASTR